MLDTDPEHCYERFICDLHTEKKMMSRPPTEPFAGRLLYKSDVVSPRNRLGRYKRSLIGAKNYGKMNKSIEKCEIKYSCPFSGSQMRKWFVVNKLEN